MDNTRQSANFRRLATIELAFFTGFLFLGLVVMPVVIYFVGQTVFGNYAGLGYSSFFATLTDKVRNGDCVAWLLILAPYFGWQVLRLLILAWRLTGPTRPAQ